MSKLRCCRNYWRLISIHLLWWHAMFQFITDTNSTKKKIRDIFAILFHFYVNFSNQENVKTSDKLLAYSTWCKIEVCSLLWTVAYLTYKFKQTEKWNVNRNNMNTVDLMLTIGVLRMQLLSDIYRKGHT